MSEVIHAPMKINAFIGRGHGHGWCWFRCVAQNMVETCLAKLDSARLGILALSAAFWPGLVFSFAVKRNLPKHELNPDRGTTLTLICINLKTSNACDVSWTRQRQTRFASFPPTYSWVSFMSFSSAESPHFAWGFVPPAFSASEPTVR